MREEKRHDRNWKEYNERLVQRGEILLAVESLKGWKEELKGMNFKKNGRPFLYPHSLILFLGILRVVFSLPYRQLEGFGRGLGRLLSIPSPDYSTLSLRIPKLDLDTGYEPRGGGGDSGRQHRDKGDQQRGMDEEEEEGLYQDPCCS
jgi:hypothetical protein